MPIPKEDHFPRKIAVSNLLIFKNHQDMKNRHVYQQPSFRPAATARGVPSTVARGVRFQHRYHCRCHLLAHRPPYAPQRSTKLIVL